MSRKRDTNWTKDEITVLLDSIMEITQMRAGGSRRTNSREVFEYAAKKLGEKGHSSRAEREKCRTKWKKMKEEFTHAKKARETGEGRIAPGIEPFYSRMLEFINGSFDNISPHSTIVRRSSSISSNNNNNNTNNSNSNNNNNNNNDIAIISSNIDNGNNSAAASSTPTNISKLSHAASRASARIAASSNGMSSNDTSDTNSTIVTRTTNVSGSDYSSAVLTPSESSPASRQNPRLSPGNPVSINSNNDNIVNTNSSRPYPALTANGTSNQNHSHQRQLALDNHVKRTPEDAFDDMNAPYSSHNHSTATNNNNISQNNNNSLLNTSNDFTNHLPPAEHDADISYRVSTGCRQITIFGDHDVDIKFRGSCVTINKISAEYTTTPGTANNSDI